METPDQERTVHALGDEFGELRIDPPGPLSGIMNVEAGDRRFFVNPDGSAVDERGRTYSQADLCEPVEY